MIAQKILLLVLANTFSLFFYSREVAFPPSKLIVSNQDLLESDVLVSKNDFKGGLDGFYIYTRNDSGFVSFHSNSGKFNEFYFPAIQHPEFGDITKIQLFDNSGVNAPNIITIESKYYFGHTGSAYSHRFTNIKSLIIIDIDNYSVLFNKQFARSYHETEFSYSGDLNDTTLSSGQLDSLIDNRKSITYSYSYEYDIQLYNTALSITQVKFSENSEEFDNSIPQGNFILSPNSYVRD